MVVSVVLARVNTTMILNRAAKLMESSKRKEEERRKILIRRDRVRTTQRKELKSSTVWLDLMNPNKTSWTELGSVQAEK